MVRVKVPATSANMGSGFDCLGIGLCLYSVVEMSEESGGLTIIDNSNMGYVPKDESNLIYAAAKRVFDAVGYNPSGIKIVQSSRIPMTRGLGSSSACIIGGALAANVLSGRKLSYSELLDIACSMEGHPDNVTPAMYGGMCAAAVSDGHVYAKSIKINSKIKAAVFIPDYFVSTKKSRGAVPESFSREDAVFNISHAALMLAAMSGGNTELLREASGDRMHQQYRKSGIEAYDFIFETAYGLGAKAVYLSGSGPTIVAVLDGKYKSFQSRAQKILNENGYNIRCSILSIDNVGTVVREII